MKMALVSSDGFNINMNLDEAQDFLVVDYSDKVNIKVESARKIHSSGSSPAMGGRYDCLKELLADCSVIFCRKADEEAKAFFRQKGFELIETMGFIPQVIYKYLSAKLEQDFYSSMKGLQGKVH